MTDNKIIPEPIDSKYMDEYNNGSTKKSIREATETSFKKIKNSAYNLIAYKTAKLANTMLDSLSLMTLGIQEIDENARDKIVKELRYKSFILRELAKDPEIQEITKDTALSVGELAKIFISEAQGPFKEVLAEAITNIQDIALDTLSEGANFGKNIVKIIPVLGDAYIIVDNVLSVAKASSNAAKLGMETSDRILTTVRDVTEKTTAAASVHLDKFNDNSARATNVANRIRANLKNIQQMDPRNQIAKTILDTGDKISESIDSQVLDLPYNSNIQTPELKTPEIKTPELKTPEIKTPEIKTPEVKTPEVKRPSRLRSKLKKKGGDNKTRKSILKNSSSKKHNKTVRFKI